MEKKGIEKETRASKGLEGELCGQSKKEGAGNCPTVAVARTKRQKQVRSSTKKEKTSDHPVKKKKKKIEGPSCVKRKRRRDQTPGNARAVAADQEVVQKRSVKFRDRAIAKKTKAIPGR